MSKTTSSVGLQTEMSLKDSRRNALKKLTGIGVISGATAALPNGWVKPVVDAVVLPAHADCTPTPENPDPCPDPDPPTLEAVSENITTPNPSGNIGTFRVTITSPDATAENPITINSLTPSSGSFIDFTPGVQVGAPLVVTWISDPGFVDGTTGIVLTGMFADVTVDVTGAIQPQYVFTIAEEGDAP